MTVRVRFSTRGRYEDHRIVGRNRTRVHAWHNCEIDRFAYLFHPVRVQSHHQACTSLGVVRQRPLTIEVTGPRGENC